MMLIPALQNLLFRWWAIHTRENNVWWGRGQWVMCTLPVCVTNGKPTFHHRSLHEGD